VYSAGLWWAWFSKKQNNDRNKELVLLIVIGTIIAVAIGKAISFVIPFSLRPVFNSDLNFTLPCGTLMPELRAWNAFPSDHAVLFFCISTGFFLMYRGISWLWYAYTFMVICFPRIYLGMHYPTDVVGGAFIGTAVMYALYRTKYTNIAMSKLLVLSEKYTCQFHACLFVATYEVANMFWEIRIAGSFAIKVLHLT
jgi:undecaprenyl-diphosphatase